MANPNEKGTTTAAKLARDKPLPPTVETAKVDVRPYHHPAAGFGAIASTMKHTDQEMGLFRGALTLLKLNQVTSGQSALLGWADSIARPDRMAQIGSTAGQRRATRPG